MPRFFYVESQGGSNADIIFYEENFEHRHETVVGQCTHFCDKSNIVSHFFPARQGEICPFFWKNSYNMSILYGYISVIYFL